ncbi:MAG: glycosyltransferase family 4 protein, partial [Chloroflexia bacterium]
VFFYPQIKKLTGAERLILKLADYAARELGQGTDVVLLTHHLADEVRTTLTPNVRLIETGWPLNLTKNHYLDAIIEYVLGPALALRIPRGKLDGVIFFGPPSVPAMWFSRRILFRLAKPRVPLLYFCFEPPRFIYRDTGDIVARLGAIGKLLRPLFSLYRVFDRRMVRSAHRVLSNSPFGSRKIAEAYGRPATVIEHGVDFTAPDPGLVESLRVRYGLPAGRIVVTVNHLHPRKRVDLFLRAVHYAAQLASSGKALVVGAGPERDYLEKLCEELGMEVGKDVVFAGAVPEAELPAHYALADVYVHTGREESFGLSVIEALSLGLPVVSVNEGGPCDTVLDGVSGYLVDATPEAMGSSIAQLWNNPDRAGMMGSTGAKFIESHYGWEQGAHTLLRTLETIKRKLR